MPPIQPITQALMLLSVALYCLDQVILGGLLTRWFGLYPLGHGFLPWQVVSYALLHGSFQHLFFNMLGLYMFGNELEALWGRKRFLQFFVASVLTAAAAQLLVTFLLGTQVPTVGASGGIYGLLLAYGMLFPNRTIMPLIPPIPMKARTFVFVFGALELVLGYLNSYSGVAHFAHLGGMLGGWLMIRYWRGQPPLPPRRRLH